MQLAKSVKYRREKFGAVLFHTESEKVYTLNPSGAAIVSEIRPGCDETSLVSFVKARFRDPAGLIERDVHALLHDLREKGLVTADPQ
jgi:hypothetical protein